MKETAITNEKWKDRERGRRKILKCILYCLHIAVTLVRKNAVEAIDCKYNIFIL